MPCRFRELFAAFIDGHAAGIRTLDFSAVGARIVFRGGQKADTTAIIKLIQQLPRVYKLDGQDK
ncbi:hypothetical protein GCM10008098_15330 [Rhodanobacter panaciterrae]|uniref:Uncharacterized protein n=1 Tax=Rhodanobacter panaciterrae TaxID=490572 RepID=A0ABQ2ZUG7_9GAMM|nr:hypothetical protein [Rhodanobacter panaciterrae]GGY22886.1 hypothetical protein GCM10008098_15330 [Rhodanobacter panaciterrae]